MVLWEPTGQEKRDKAKSEDLMWLNKVAVPRIYPKFVSFSLEMQTIEESRHITIRAKHRAGKTTPHKCHDYCLSI